ncbi:TPA: hypothetical protein N0F65_008125, partial [Lagenidium giganteum]
LVDCIATITAIKSCRCGQSWADGRVRHLCNLIEPDVVVGEPARTTNGTSISSTTASLSGLVAARRPAVMKTTPATSTVSNTSAVAPAAAATTTTADSTVVASRGRSGSNAVASESIQVFVRIRPLVERETSDERTALTHSIRVPDAQTIEVRTSDASLSCKYDAVFDPSCTQEQVYERVRECTQSFLKGFNSTLFAYGQTGSGKSFTMFGAETDLSRYRPGLHKSQAGIIPRAIKEIFAGIVQKEHEAQAMVYCSFVQIYNEHIYDLLRDGNMDKPLDIHEDRRNGIYVEGLSEYAVRSVADCLALLQCGEQHRAVRSTHMNQVSSRSHSVFQLLLEQKKKDGTTIKSKLNLVDLAGSEKWNMDSNMLDNHISEMTNINLSLHTLGRCIAALTAKSGQRAHVPYRDSKLTRLLQDSLGGNCKTKIIATLSPSLDCIEESISTLKFADRAKQVMVMARVNEQREIDPAYVDKLQDEIAQLRELVRILQSNGTTKGKDVSGALNAGGGNYDDNNSALHPEDNPGDQTELHTKLVRLIQENTELKVQIDKQHKEFDQLRQSRGSETSALQTKQQLEASMRELNDASDKFFRFEIEEEELKGIHESVFRRHNIGAVTSGLSFSKPRPPITKSISSNPMSSSPLQSPGSFKAATTVPGGGDLLYRVRSRSTSAGDKSRGNNASGQSEWKNDGPSKQALDPDKELEQSRKAIAKQAKLQAWLMEKEKRELLRLQSEQEYIGEQRRLMAEKDAKFYKNAAATKKKLQQMHQQQASGAPPATAE